MRSLDLLACAAALSLSAHAAAPTEQPMRHSAPLHVTQPGAFLQLPLPASAYARSEQANLADLRIVDSKGERVPYAWVPANEDLTRTDEQTRTVALFPLPRRVAAGAALGSPLEVTVQGDRIRVSPVQARAATTPGETPGWLVDLGEAQAGATAVSRPAQTLRVSWSGPVEFSAALDIDTSDRLRDWRPIGSGQLLALAAGTDRLVQRDLQLPAGTGRFVRLVWRDAAQAPVLSGAQALTVHTQRSSGDPLTELSFAANAAPVTTDKPADKAPAPPGALYFDLGGLLPVRSIDLKLPIGTRVMPARIQGRSQPDAPWQDLGSTVFYRLQRDDTASRSSPWALQATVRHLRVVPDARTQAIEPAQTQLVVQARLPTLVFAAQGLAPYTLQAGSRDAPAGALPLETLVPHWRDEQARLGRAEVGLWQEVPEVARAAEAEARQAALRPWLLWGVLLAGVGTLGFMVWRLSRTRPVKPA